MTTTAAIKVMPLLDAQKLVVDLRLNVPVNDKLYPQAQALITVATGRKDWKEPELIEVRNLADHDLTVDKTKIPKDGTGKIYGWQYIAVLRFVEAVNPDDHTSAVDKFIRKPGAFETGVPAAPSTGLTADDVAKIVVKTLKDLGITGAATLIAFAFLLLCSGKAMAQAQTYAAGSTPSIYHSYFVAGLNGGTNAWTQTNNSFATPVTNVVSIITNANWQIINGQETNEFTTTTNVTVNTPGIVGLENYDEAEIFFGFAPMTSAGLVTGGTVTWDYSPDGVNWQLNALSMYVATNALNFVGTNYFFPIGGVPGLLRLDSVVFPGTGYGSNVTVEVALKPNRTGP